MMTTHKRCFENEKEYCVMAEDAANAAVEKVFKIFGVDVHDPQQVKEFQEDIRFGGLLRKLANKFAMGAVGALAVAFIAALFYGIASKLGVK